MDDSRMLTPEEVSEYLKVSQSTLNRIVLDGDLPMYKVRGSCRYFASDVKAYVAGCRKATVAPGIKIPRTKSISTRPRECKYIPGMKVV